MATTTTTELPERRRFNVDEYYAMGEAGILTERDGIELLDGELFCKYDGRRRRFTVGEYYRMAEVGILAPDERVELLAGEIIKMAAVGSRHAFCVDEFTEKLMPLAISGRARIRTQNPIQLDEDNHPQPDIAVVARMDYLEAHPLPEDVMLLIEVADTSAGFDRRHKLPMYALHGIPEVWLGDINARTVEVYDQPMAAGYGRVRVFDAGEMLSLAAFPDLEIPVGDVMPE
ncbi:MAG: Uma2 family endonuclease [Chloroflexi bacterium]|nr:Uma2 family endonuclease [Chloroflexota bacterium]